MTEQEYMKVAIRKAQDGIELGQSPFGSAIVSGDRVIAATHNTVWRDTDPTAHAEVNCIRAASHELKTISLHGCTLGKQLHRNSGHADHPSFSTSQVRRAACSFQLFGL